MTSSHIVFPLACAILIGCGDEVSVSFGSLAGSYQLNDDCFIHVSGSKGNASCAWQVDPELKWSGELEFKLGEKSISATLNAVKQERWCDWWGEDCDPWTTCTYVITGKADKRVGRSAEGMFSALSGSWSGYVDIRESCRYDQGGTYIEETSVVFTPEIGGNGASITYTVHRNGRPDPQRRFSVNVDGSGLDVAGEWIRKL